MLKRHYSILETILLLLYNIIYITMYLLLYSFKNENNYNNNNNATQHTHAAILPFFGEDIKIKIIFYP